MAQGLPQVQEMTCLVAVPAEAGGLAQEHAQLTNQKPHLQAPAAVAPERVRDIIRNHAPLYPDLAAISRRASAEVAAAGPAHYLPANSVSGPSNRTAARPTSSFSHQPLPVIAEASGEGLVAASDRPAQWRRLGPNSHQQQQGRTGPTAAGVIPPAAVASPQTQASMSGSEDVSAAGAELKPYKSNSFSALSGFFRAAGVAVIDGTELDPPPKGGAAAAPPAGQVRQPSAASDQDSIASAAEELDPAKSRSFSELPGYFRAAGVAVIDGTDLDPPPREAEAHAAPARQLSTASTASRYSTASGQGAEGLKPLKSNSFSALSGYFRAAGVAVVDGTDLDPPAKGGTQAPAKVPLMPWRIVLCCWYRAASCAAVQGPREASAGMPAQSILPPPRLSSEESPQRSQGAAGVPECRCTCLQSAVGGCTGRLSLLPSAPCPPPSWSLDSLSATEPHPYHSPCQLCLLILGHLRIPDYMFATPDRVR